MSKSTSPSNLNYLFTGAPKNTKIGMILNWMSKTWTTIVKTITVHSRVSTGRYTRLPRTVTRSARSLMKGSMAGALWRRCRMIQLWKTVRACFNISSTIGKKARIILCWSLWLKRNQRFEIVIRRRQLEDLIWRAAQRRSRRMTPSLGYCLGFPGHLLRKK